MSDQKYLDQIAKQLDAKRRKDATLKGKAYNFLDALDRGVTYVKEGPKKGRIKEDQQVVARNPAFPGRHDLYSPTGGDSRPGQIAPADRVPEYQQRLQQGRVQRRPMNLSKMPRARARRIGEAFIDRIRDAAQPWLYETSLSSGSPRMMTPKGQDQQDTEGDTKKKTAKKQPITAGRVATGAAIGLGAHVLGTGVAYGGARIASKPLWGMVHKTARTVKDTPEVQKFRSYGQFQSKKREGSTTPRVRINDPSIPQNLKDRGPFQHPLSLSSLTKDLGMKGIPERQINLSQDKQKEIMQKFSTGGYNRPEIHMERDTRKKTLSHADRFLLGHELGHARNSPFRSVKGNAGSGLKAAELGTQIIGHQAGLSLGAAGAAFLPGKWAKRAAIAGTLAALPHYANETAANIRSASRHYKKFGMKGFTDQNYGAAKVLMGSQGSYTGAFLAPMAVYGARRGMEKVVSKIKERRAQKPSQRKRNKRDRAVAEAVDRIIESALANAAGSKLGAGGGMGSAPVINNSVVSKVAGGANVGSGRLGGGFGTQGKGSGRFSGGGQQFGSRATAAAGVQDVGHGGSFGAPVGSKMSPGGPASRGQTTSAFTGGGSRAGGASSPARGGQKTSLGGVGRTFTGGAGANTGPGTTGNVTGTTPSPTPPAGGKSSSGQTQSASPSPSGGAFKGSYDATGTFMAGSGTPMKSFGAGGKSKNVYSNSQADTLNKLGSEREAKQTAHDNAVSNIKSDPAAREASRNILGSRSQSQPNMQRERAFAAGTSGGTGSRFAGGGPRPVSFGGGGGGGSSWGHSQSGYRNTSSFNIGGSVGFGGGSSRGRIGGSFGSSSTRYGSRASGWSQ